MLVVDDKHGSNDFNESKVDDLVSDLSKKQQEEEWDMVLWEEEWNEVGENGEVNPTSLLVLHSSYRQCSNLLITSALLTFPMEKTNKFAQYRLEKYAKIWSLYCNWKPVKVTEMNEFVGIILNIRIILLYTYIHIYI